MDEAGPDALTDVGVGTLSTGTPYVMFRGRVERCRLLRPTAELPCLIRDNERTLFELPVASGRGSGGEEETEVDAGAAGRHRIRLTRGLRPSLRTESEDEKEEPAELSASDAVQSLVSFHIERCCELVFPSRAGGSFPQRRIRGLTRSDWENARSVYWDADEVGGPLRLIVRIAEECSNGLQSVCTQPRRILRRLRRPTRLERVQQVDDACVRWLVRQPGRSVLEKAGPQRRVLSVERVETADTPENRIIREFLVRCLRECRLYLHECPRHRGSYRYRIVQRFRMLAARLMRTTEIGEVPGIVGEPAPNYVLQFDERYAPLWVWYERLRRQQIAADDAWIWRRRVLVEHARLAIAHTLSAVEGPAPTLKRLYLRGVPDRGWLMSAESILTGWNVEGVELAHLVVGSELVAAARAGVIPAWVTGIGADLVLTRGRGSPPLAVYAQFAVEPGEADRLIAGMGSLAASLDRASISPEAPVLLLIADAVARDPQPCLLEMRTTSGGRRCCAAALPVPPSSASADLTEPLRTCGVLP